MELFFRNPGTALVREKILEGVWGKNYFGDVKIVDVNIRRLRIKIEDDATWADVKAGKLQGFSVEGVFGYVRERETEIEADRMMAQIIDILGQVRQ